MKRLHAAAGPVYGPVTVPGSKSIANRALVAAALARGDSRLTNVPDGEDTAAMLHCLAPWPSPVVTDASGPSPTMSTPAWQAPRRAS